MQLSRAVLQRLYRLESASIYDILEVEEKHGISAHSNNRRKSLPECAEASPQLLDVFVEAGKAGAQGNR